MKYMLCKKNSGFFTYLRSSFPLLEAAILDGEKKVYTPQYIKWSIKNKFTGVTGLSQLYLHRVQNLSRDKVKSKLFLY